MVEYRGWFLTYKHVIVWCVADLLEQNLDSFDLRHDFVIVYGTFVILFLFSWGEGGGTGGGDVTSL